MAQRKKLLFGKQARDKVLVGVEKLARAVAGTMGAAGRDVLIDREFDVMMTRDGVRVARDIELEDEWENMGCKLIKQAAERTNSEAGDGTTTATILAYRMMKLGSTYLDGNLKEKMNAIELRQGLQAAKDMVVKFLKEQAVTVDTEEDYRAIATLSSYDEDIGREVAAMFKKVGKDGIVTIEQQDAPAS